jgi:hypothetical protein
MCVLRTDSTGWDFRSSVGLLTEDHLDDGRARQGEKTNSPYGAISLGSPGARNSHAGKYGEVTPLRQRGGAGYDLPLTH